MGLSKRWFLTTLVMVVAFAAVPRFEVQTKEPDVSKRNSRPYHPVVASDESLWHTNLVRSNWVLHAKREISSTVFLPVQSKNSKDVGAGKLLVASRALGDPNFAETVILLVHSDADGVVGLILNRRTDVPLSRVLDQFEGAKDRSRPGLSRWSRRNSSGVCLVAVDGQARRGRANLGRGLLDFYQKPLRKSLRGSAWPWHVSCLSGLCGME